MMFEVYDELNIPDLMGKRCCRAKKSHSDWLHESLNLGGLLLRLSGTVKEGFSKFLNQLTPRTAGTFLSSGISDLELVLVAASPLEQTKQTETASSLPRMPRISKNTGHLSLLLDCSQESGITR
jgi:hypothetical protein